MYAFVFILILIVVAFFFCPQQYMGVRLGDKLYMCKRKYASIIIQSCNFVHASSWLLCVGAIIEAHCRNWTPMHFFFSAHIRRWLCPEAAANWLTDTFSRWKASDCLSHLATAAGMIVEGNAQTSRSTPTEVALNCRGILMHLMQIQKHYYYLEPFDKKLY